MRAGHQIILLTKSLQDDEQQKSVESVAREMAVHNWSKPYLLSCVPAKNSVLRKQRKGLYSSLQSKSVVAFNYLVRSGVFADWVQGTRLYWQVLVSEFRPDIAWATFGNTDSLAIAQGIARTAKIPWVIDVKDGWKQFIPRPIHGLVARRFRDAAWITSNSEFSAAQARPWFRQAHTVVYSGVDLKLLSSDRSSNDGKRFKIVLSGGLYREPVLRKFLCGLQMWLDDLQPHYRSEVTVVYAGSDTEMFKRNSVGVESRCRVEVRGYLPFPKFCEIIRSASVNAYLWLPATFHHKLIELLACNRPVIAFPGEHEESKAIARRVRGDLNCCQTPEMLVGCLESIRKGEHRAKWGVSSQALQHFTWDAQAKLVLQLFSRVLDESGKGAVNS